MRHQTETTSTETTTSKNTNKGTIMNTKKSVSSLAALATIGGALISGAVAAPAHAGGNPSAGFGVSVVSKTDEAGKPLANATITFTAKDADARLLPFTSAADCASAYDTFTDARYAAYSKMNISEDGANGSTGAQRGVANDAAFTSSLPKATKTLAVKTGADGKARVCIVGVYLQDTDISAMETAVPAGYAINTTAVGNTAIPVAVDVMKAEGTAKLSPSRDDAATYSASQLTPETTTYALYANHGNPSECDLGATNYAEVCELSNFTIVDKKIPVVPVKPKPAPKMTSVLVQVDQYLPYHEKGSWIGSHLLKSNKALTSTEKKKLATLDNDRVLKYREDRLLWGASHYKIISVKVPVGYTQAQLVAAVNKATPASLGKIQTTSTFNGASRASTMTVFWTLGKGATVSKPWGTHHNINQTFIGRSN